MIRKLKNRLNSNINQQGYKDCTLKLIPEEDHSFTKNTAEAALYASDWLSKQIKDD